MKLPNHEDYKRNLTVELRQEALNLSFIYRVSNVYLSYI